MKFTGTFKVENFKELGIPYLKGMLNTYASLNQPDSNLAYDYNIIKIKKENQDLIKAVKSDFVEFANQSFKLDLISDERFKTVLQNWLFETKFVSDLTIEREIAFVYDLIKEVTDFKSIYAVNELDSTTFSYNFGVYYEYFLLDGTVDLYLIYFNYTD